MNPIGEFGAMLIAALLIVGAFLVGRGIGLGVRSWIQFFRDRRVESRTAVLPQASPPPVIVQPVGPGPLWQNSRLFEENHLRGRVTPQRGFRQTAPLPEIKTVRYGARQYPPMQSDDGFNTEFADGHDRDQL